MGRESKIVEEVERGREGGSLYIMFGTTVWYSIRKTYTGLHTICMCNTVIRRREVREGREGGKKGRREEKEGGKGRSEEREGGKTEREGRELERGREHKILLHS